MLRNSTRHLLRHAPGLDQGVSVSIEGSMARFMSSVQNDLKEVLSSKIPAEQVRHLGENDQSSEDLFMGDSVFGCDQSIRCHISCYVGESENI